MRERKFIRNTKVKSLALLFIIFTFIFSGLIPANFSLAYDDEYAQPFIDYTGKFDSSADRFYDKIAKVGNKHEYDIAVIVDSSEEEGVDLDDMDGTARAIRESYGYSDDCALMFIALKPDENYEHGKYQIISHGKGQNSITTDVIDYMLERINSLFGDGKFEEGIDFFIDTCDGAITAYENGEEFDTKDPFPWGKRIIISLGIGLVIGLIVAFSLRGQLKSVKSERTASYYYKDGSMHVTGSQDIFLYRTVDRTARSNDNNSSSGGGSSSSGGYNSGGGSF